MTESQILNRKNDIAREMLTYQKLLHSGTDGKVRQDLLDAIRVLDLELETLDMQSKQEPFFDREISNTSRGKKLTARGALKKATNPEEIKLNALKDIYQFYSRQHIKQNADDFDQV